jgi:phosphatidylglycerophosphatase A
MPESRAEILRGPERKRKLPEDTQQERPPPTLAGWLATGLGVGFAPVAPGTFGSALGVLLFVPLLRLPPGYYVIAVVVVAGLGIWAADVTERATGRHDDGRIVIDEVAGQLVTYAPLVFAPRGAPGLPVLLVTGFVTFRVLDIWKPGPVRWLERRVPGGAGVMADDLLAGALGAGLLWAGLWALESFGPGLAAGIGTDEGRG